MAALDWERGGEEGCSSESHNPLESGGVNRDTEPAVDSGQGGDRWLLWATAEREGASRLRASATPDKAAALSKDEELS